MKLWRASVNNGDWNGLHTFSTMAESPEEAERKMNLDEWRVSEYFVSPIREVTGQDILDALGVPIREKEREAFRLDYKLVHV